MSFQDFDRHFREKLYSHTTPLDTEGLWKGVEAGLTGQKKPAAFWWAAGAVSVLIVGVLLAYAVFTRHDANGTSTPSETTLGQKNSQKRNTAASPPIISEVSAKDGSNNEGILNETERTAKGTEGGEDDMQAQLSPPGAKTDHPSEKSNVISAKTHPPHANASRALIETSDRDTESGDRANAKDMTDASEIPGPKALDLPASSLPRTVGMADNKRMKEAFDMASAAEPGVIFTGSEAEGQNPPGTNRPEQKTHQHQNLEDKYINSLPLLKLPRIEGPLTRTGTYPTFHTVRREIPQYGPASSLSGYFIAAEFGAGNFRRNFIPLHEDARRYAEERSNTEHPLEYLTGQISFGKRYAGGFFWRTGIALTRINEHFLMDRTDTEVTETTVVTGMHIDPIGDTLFTYGSAAETIVTHVYMSHYNTYRIIDIPVFVGFDKSLGRWRIGAEAGVFLNVRTAARGSAVSQEAEVIRMENHNLYSAQLRLSPAFNARLGYTVSERVMLRLSPGVRMISERYLSNGDIGHRMVLYGGTFGIGYCF